MSYDEGKYHSKRTLVLGDSTGTSVAGTQASDKLLYRIRAPKAMTITAGTVVALTGGTAAGPNIVIGKSLAGTGAIAGLATHNFGTSADNASAALTVASTDFAAGDHLCVSIVAGTAASTPKMQLALDWVEDF